MEAGILGRQTTHGILGRLEHGLAREGTCAVLIQTKYRGKLEHRNIVKAAIKVQAAGRGSKVRRDLGKAKEKLRAELEELEKSVTEAEDPAPKRTKSQERGRAEEEEAEEEGGGEAIALRHQRPDPDVEPAELQRQLKLYVNQLEKQERTLKKEIEKIKRERPYLNATDQRGNTEKRRAAQRKLEEVAVELRAQRELQHEIRATEKVQGHLIGKRPVNSTRATALERFETRLGAMQRRWRRRQARLLLAPKLTKVCLRLRTEPAPPVSLTLRATGDEQPCAVRVWAAFAAPSKKKGAASSAHVVVAAALHVRCEAVEEEEAGGEEAGEEEAGEKVREELMKSAMPKPNKVMKGIRKAVAGVSGAAIIHAVHKYIGHYKNQGGGGGGSKLRVMKEGGGATGKEIFGSIEVRLHAWKYGEHKLGKKGKAYMEAVREAMKWTDNGKTYEGKYKNETYDDAVERYITWTAYEAAVKKAEVDKAVGTDGFSVYALRRAPKEIREKTWRLVKEIMKQKKMPKTWSEWVAMLAMKPGEAPENLSRRRDLWITAGMQKVIMRCIKTEYERAADERVPGSAAGFTANRNGPEHTLKSRLAREHAMQIDGVVCTAYVDYTQMFMSIVKDCQRETERYCGVHPGVTEIVDMLHSEVRGCYETEYGLTNWFKIMIGTGQGCVNGATRAKLALTLTQKTIHKVCA